MKNEFDRALTFAESKLGPTDCVILGCDFDSQGNVRLYSNRPLKGYTKTNGIYENVVPLAELTSRQRSALQRYLITGPSLRQTNLQESDSVYTRDLETDLFKVNNHPEYVFLPTKDITRELISDDLSYPAIAERIGTNPSDSILVHELAHRIPNGTKRRLAKRFGLGDERKFSTAVQEEFFAKYTEMLYIQETYPDLVGLRLGQFRDEIAKQKARPMVDDHRGRDPHPPASKLYFAVLKNDGLKEFVESLYTK